jgi:hypothetical protein
MDLHFLQRDWMTRLNRAISYQHSQLHPNNNLPVSELRVGHYEAHPKEQLPGMKFYLGVLMRRKNCPSLPPW